MNDKTKYEKIYICSSDLKADEFARCVGSYFGVDAVKLTDDPCLMRRVVAKCSHDELVVVDSIQASMDPRNIASALLSDGHKVVLVVDDGVDTEEYALIDSSDKGELIKIKRDEFGFESEIEEKPIKNIEMPEEEYSWDNIRNVLKEKAQKYKQEYASGEYESIDEVDGILLDQDKSAPAVSIPIEHKSSNPSISKEKAKRGKSIAFCSGRGGVGKSSLVSMAGLLAASWNLKVIMVDLDLFCGNLYMHFGEPSIASLTSIRDVDCNVDKVIENYAQKVGNGGLWLLGALDHPEEAELVVPYYELLLNGLLDRFDLVLIDIPNTWCEYDVRVLRQVDRMIVVADERASSVTSMVRTMNLANRLGVVRTKMIRLINRCDSYGFDQKFIQKAEEGSYCPHTFYVEDGGRQIAEYLSCGKATELIGIKNACVRTWSESLSSILADMGIHIDSKTVHRTNRGMLSGLLSFFGKASLRQGEV